ncbi:hypothetical protein [Burkholderia metallica]|uniref:hypothetical protein n=1 Tax=Burkholderia metallica TaxID=488729 RepID=UPI000D1A6F77|nr:hypothetical protein [Burkholderia metallica]
MNRIASPARGTLAAANRIEVVDVAGTAVPASVADISPALVIAGVADVFKRVNGTSPAFSP